MTSQAGAMPQATVIALPNTTGVAATWMVLLAHDASTGTAAQFTATRITKHARVVTLLHICWPGGSCAICFQHLSTPNA